MLSTIYKETPYLWSLREIDYRTFFPRWRIKFHVRKSRAGLISQRLRCCAGRHAANNLLFSSHLRSRHPPPDVTDTLAKSRRSHASLRFGLIPAKRIFSDAIHGNELYAIDYPNGRYSASTKSIYAIMEGCVEFRTETFWTLRVSSNPFEAILLSSLWCKLLKQYVILNAVTSLSDHCICYKNFKKNWNIYFSKKNKYNNYGKKNTFKEIDL